MDNIKNKNIYSVFFVVGISVVIYMICTHKSSTKPISQNNIEALDVTKEINSKYQVESSLNNEHNVVVLKPQWGLGNRLRTIRKAYIISKLLNRRLVIVEHKDHGFDHHSIRELLELSDIKSIHESAFKMIRKNKLKQGLLKYIKRDIHIGKCETIINDSRMHELKNTRSNVLIYFKTCDFLFEGSLQHFKFDRSFYTETPSIFTKNKETLRSMFSQNKNIHRASRIVGIHIRQGNVNDYIKGNFFGKWDNSDMTMAPYFPQFLDQSKNLSAYHPRAPPMEYFIRLIDSYDESVIFFVCSDRIGTLIYLYQKYPNRILMNPIVLQNELPDTAYGLKDLVALSKCDEIIATGIGSFSTESAVIRNIPLKRVWEQDIVT